MERELTVRHVFVGFVEGRNLESGIRNAECWSILYSFILSLLAEIRITIIIIHQTHYEKSNWSRAFNQFTIACELDMINAISAADIAFIAFIMSSSTSAWLPSPLECSPRKQNG